MEKADYTFKRKLKFLKKQRGQGTELISIYIPPDYNVNEVVSKLRDEAGQAMNIKSKQTRKNVTSAIERLLHALKGTKKTPSKGIALFSGNIGGRIELYNIKPPEPIPVQVYRCDSEFFLEPLERMIAPKQVYGLMTVDRREAAIALLKGKHLEIVKTLGSQVPGKHRAGGQSSVRFERLIEIAAHEWFKKVGEIASKVFDDSWVIGVIVGGPGPTKEEFVKGDYLSAVTKKKVVGTIDTSYTDESGIKELVEKSGQLVGELEVLREKRLINEFFKEASTDGLATYGLDEVLEALTYGKVKTLLLSEDLEKKKLILVCPHCGKKQEKIVDRTPNNFGKCPSCGTPLMLDEEEDLIEYLSDFAESTSAEVEIISTETPEGEQFFKTFGGIGALLRFK
ncbi:MAG: peptide chain release factor aRF-1 [Candidatus Diapherotrites archaeon]|nr:peptide chain release factor aRF-1 [Candidatus Diapherotrites archaeon]